MNFSVLISVYHKESASNLEISLNSVCNQTRPPDEIVLIKDGPLTDTLEALISTFLVRYPNLFRIISLSENRGLGEALQIGVEQCSYEIIARMDTDDYARSDRFEKQLKFLEEHLDVDVVGCNMEEFNLFPGDLKRYKINPETHNQLVKSILLRNPFNHPTVMYRKSSVLAAGNYSADHFLFEDYALFLRMWKADMKFHNLQQVLLDFRVGSGIETIKRRSGRHYLEKEKAFLKYAQELGVFGKLDVLKYKVLKFPIRLLPPKIVLFVYNTFLRK